MMEYRYDIQILRGISVLFVVLFHLNVFGFQSGFLGVDVFFVISGYLMALLFDRSSARDFYKRRIRRLLPAYVATIAVTLAAASYLTAPVDFNQLVEQSLFASIFSSNIGFWLKNSYFSKAEFNPLLNLWSLGVEAQFYAVVPVLFSFIRAKKALTIVLAAVSLLGCFAVATISPKTSFFHMPLRVWEFLLGAMVAWYWTGQLRGAWVKSVGSYLLLIALFAMLFVPIAPESLRFGLGHPGWAALSICLLAALIIAVGIPVAFQGSRFGKSLAVIGDYSYSIYLVHFPIIVLTNYSEFGGTRLGFDSVPSLFFIVITTIVLATLSYRWVETRGSALCKGTRPIYLLFAAVSIGVMSSYGNTERFSLAQHKIFSAWTDRSVYRCGKIFRILNPNETICEITNLGLSAQKRVLFIGDSHADSIKISLAEMFEREGVGVYFYVPNNPLESDAYSEKIVHMDSIRLSIDAVILHFNSQAYSEKLVRRISELAGLLSSEDIPTFVLAPMPSYDEHIPRYLYDETVGVGRLSRQTLRDYYARNELFWESAELWLRDEIRVIDATRLICDELCQIADSDGRPYYFDSHHLTLTGARLLEPVFADLANEIARLD